MTRTELVSALDDAGKIFHIWQRHLALTGCNMSSTKLEELNAELYALEAFWRRLAELFPQFDADCVQYVPVGSPYNNLVTRMDWVIPEVTEEYWKKVMPRALPMNVDIVFDATVRRAVVYIRSPVLREFDVKSWAFIITSWWGG